MSRRGGGHYLCFSHLKTAIDPLITGEGLGERGKGAGRRGGKRKGILASIFQKRLDPF